MRPQISKIIHKYLVEVFFILINVLLSGIDLAQATTHSVTCSGDITSALNSAVSSAFSDDIISIGPGSCSSNGVNVVDKQLTIQGAGQGATNLTANRLPIFTIQRENSDNANWRITGMTITGPQTEGIIIMLWGEYGNATPNDLWRIDHLTLDFPTLHGIAIHVYGPTWGLIDHCNISQGSGMVINGQSGYADEDGTIEHLYGSYLFSLPLQPGSNQAIYIEDNVITGTGAGVAVIDTSNYGTRFVVRHNTITKGMFYAHWTRSGGVNGFWFEIYNNKVSWSDTEMFPARFEAGTGLIYNNTFAGFSYMYLVLDERRGGGYENNFPLLSCDGTRNWDGNAGDVSAPGWPCLGQIGRASGVTLTQIQAGTKQASFPFYSWNNGTQNKCYNPSASGPACTNTVNFSSWTSNYVKSTPHTVAGGGYGQGDVDFCSGGTSQPAACGTHVLTYAAYLYPHPLQGFGGRMPPAVPNGLTIK